MATAMEPNTGRYSTRPKSKGVENPVAKSQNKNTTQDRHTLCVFPMAYAQRQAISDQLRSQARYSKMQARGSRYSGGAGAGGGWGNLSFAAIKQPMHPAVRAAVGLARMNNPPPTETKYFDTSFQATIATSADWTGTEVPMTNYIQSDGTTVGAYTDSALLPSAIGAGYGQVNGAQFYLKKLRVRGAVLPTVLPDQADVRGPFTVRLCLVYDGQPNGAQAQGENVFTDMGSTYQCVHSFLAMAAGSGGRFRVLKDKTFVLQPGVAGTDGASTNSITNGGAQFSFSVNWRKALRVILKANSSTPTVASLSNCNIFLLALSSGASTNVYGCSRAYFTD